VPKKNYRQQKRFSTANTWTEEPLTNISYGLPTLTFGAAETQQREPE